MNRRDSDRETVAVTVRVPVDELAGVAPRPEFISQLNCEHVTGLSRRKFLETTRRDDFPVPVKRVGKLRLVPYDQFVAWLRNLDEGNEEQSDEQRNSLDGADQVLSELGYR